MSLWFGLFFPFLSRVRIWICWFVFFRSTSTSAVRSPEKTHARGTGLSWLGFDVVELGFFLFLSQYGIYAAATQQLCSLSVCVYQSYLSYIFGGVLSTYLECVHALFFFARFRGIVLLSSNRGRLVRGVFASGGFFCVAVFCLAPVCRLVALAYLFIY